VGGDDVRLDIPEEDGGGDLEHGSILSTGIKWLFGA
jgi:hypothetical protein